VFTGTVLSGIRHRPSVVVMILRGFAQGVPTQHLADELDLDYSGAQLEWRHRLQESALRTLAGREKLSDPEAEADELFLWRRRENIKHARTVHRRDQAMRETHSHLSKSEVSVAARPRRAPRRATRGVANAGRRYLSGGPGSTVGKPIKTRLEVNANPYRWQPEIS
jgi:hypothetical protein